MAVAFAGTLVEADYSKCSLANSYGMIEFPPDEI